MKCVKNAKHKILLSTYLVLTKLQNEIHAEMILILSENAAGEKSSKEFFSRLSMTYKDVRPSEQTTRYLKPLVEADLLRKKGKGTGRSSGYILSLVSESLYDISRLYLLVRKADPGKVRKFMKSEFYMESLSRYIGHLGDVFDFRRPLDFRLFQRPKPDRTGLLLDDYALANPILIKPDDTTNLSNFSARIGRMPEGVRFPTLAVDVSNRDMLYLHADPFQEERKCEILERYDFRQILRPEVYNYIDEQASWKDAMRELRIIEGTLVAEKLIGSMPEQDMSFNEHAAAGSETTGKKKGISIDNMIDNFFSTIDDDSEYVDDITIEQDTASRAPEIKEVQDVAQRAIDENLRKWIENGMTTDEAEEDMSSKYYAELQDKRQTLFLERLRRRYPNMTYDDLLFRPAHEASAFRYIVKMLQTSISMCDFLFFAIIDSVKIEITSRVVPCTELIFNKEVTGYTGGSSWLPLVAHVLRNDPIIKMNEGEKKFMIVSGQAFLEEIESLDDSSALKVIFNESLSRSALMQGYDPKTLKRNFYGESMMNHSLTLGDIALISVFHAPRPEFIELAGANVDIEISQEDLYFLKDHGIKIADLWYTLNNG